MHTTIDGKKIAIKNEQEASAIKEALEKAEYKVLKVKKGTRTCQPPPPFITSALQQDTARKFGMTGERTMRIAQQLYEGIDIKGMGTTGLITYMRTDSVRISRRGKSRRQSVHRRKFR